MGKERSIAMSRQHWNGVICHPSSDLRLPGAGVAFCGQVAGCCAASRNR
jgi:hypothetical protein